MCNRFTLNQKYHFYIIDEQVTSLMDEIKTTIFKSASNFEAQVVNRLNQGSSVTYCYKLTQKYLVLKCTECSKFSFWFKNVDGHDVSTLSQNELNVTLFRAINRNHTHLDHPKIKF